MYVDHSAYACKIARANRRTSTQCCICCIHVLVIVIFMQHDVMMSKIGTDIWALVDQHLPYEFQRYVDIISKCEYGKRLREAVWCISMLRECHNAIRRHDACSMVTCIACFLSVLGSFSIC